MTVNARSKKNIFVFVGAGLSAAFTGGDNPSVGRKPLPTLVNFSRELLDFLKSGFPFRDFPLPFQESTVERVIDRLEENEQLGPAQSNFEELLSILAIQNTMASGGLLRGLPYVFDPEVLDCLLYFIPWLFADRLAIDGQLQKNRNFFYAVRREDIVRAFQQELWRFCDSNNVTFVSFNYDGLLEAFLDCALGPGREHVIFRYHPEFSHGIPLTKPEYALGRQFGHNFSNRELRKAPSLPMIFKPHGSMHFYTVPPEMAKIMGAPSMLAVQPRFGMPGIQHNDIPEVSIWNSASPAPFIIPPVMNKDRFLLEDYSRMVIPKMIRALGDADYIVSLGFSIPRSDLYIRSMLRC
jgi:hypothetical protein